MLTNLSLDHLFSSCAWMGTTVYILRLLIGFASGDVESADTLDHHESDSAFKFLSVNALFGFFMMFGWGGLAASRQFLLSDAFSVLIALMSGTSFILMLKFIFKSAKKLVSSGTVFDIQQAIGKHGTVYQSIGEGKRGVIHVIVQDFKRELVQSP